MVTLNRIGQAFTAIVLVGTHVVTPEATAQTANDDVRFRTHTIATLERGGYQPIVVDMNADGRLDVIALSVGLDQLAWYENPGWERHLIADGLNRSINLAPHDLDGDGIPELVLAHEFGTTHADSLGVVSLLTHDGDPRARWTMREIDRAPTAHRLRWADIDGSGRKVLINSPLAGLAATSPDYRDDTPIYWYNPEDWSRHVVTGVDGGVVHGLLVKPWQDPDRDAVFSASFLGVHVHQFIDGDWVRTRITEGAPAEWPASGASEVETGRLGDQTYVATIEPWHGDQVVVYREDEGAWSRQVIGTINGGHTIVTADFDGDGRDEIVAGDRGDGQTLYLWSAEDDDTRWTRQVVDDQGMAPSGCLAVDMNRDYQMDIVCIGGRTSNLKWYENLSR
ncbi:MAG: hypothetical protein CL483_04505 [Acidobacteria bacterium]|nr:hypothetical protein [Acidobacteriota bacterium]|tara:strand:- start:1255 stop:2436 length:1182 start_codon:yes stop_codon:yes gene_type:complete